jgi:hypothetical protein
VEGLSNLDPVIGCSLVFSVYAGVYAQLPCHKLPECDSKDSFTSSTEVEERRGVYALPVNNFILWLFMGRTSFIFTQLSLDSELYDVLWCQGICGKKKERFYETCVDTEVPFVVARLS